MSDPIVASCAISFDVPKTPEEQVLDDQLTAQKKGDLGGLRGPRWGQP